MLKIEKVEIANDHIVSFVTDKGVLKVELEGDCCSRSYFTDASIDEIREIEPGEMISFIEESYSGSKNDGEIKYYFLHIKTDKRTLALDWRNESNGYYAGSVNFYWNGPKGAVDKAVGRSGFLSRLICGAEGEYD